VPAGTYTLTLGQLSLGAITLNGAGPGVTTIDANQQSRALLVVSYNGPTSISDLTVTGGLVTGGEAGGGIRDGGTSALTLTNVVVTNNQAAQGGGIEDSGGSLTLTNTTVTSNHATLEGGGVYDGSPDPLTITGSTISHNASGEGGGIYARNSGTVTITDSTIDGNSASTAGGGAYFLQRDATITNSTITGNTTTASSGSPAGGGLDIAGAADAPAVLALLNATIDANSTPHGTGGNLYTDTYSTVNSENSIVADGAASTSPNCAGPGTLNSQGHNLESGTDCHFATAGDLHTKQTLLGPLQENGGPTRTQAFSLPGSPALDAAHTTDCPTTDQRGVTRPQGTACDIGALEAATPTATTTTAKKITPISATVTGTLTPNTLLATPSTFAFQYGTTPSLGQTTPTPTSPTASATTPVTAHLAQLRPKTTYYFRLLATNADGATSTGTERTFTTPNATVRVTNSGHVTLRTTGKTITVFPGITIACPTWAKSCTAAISARAERHVAGKAKITLAPNQRRHALFKLLPKTARQLYRTRHQQLKVTVKTHADTFPNTTTTKTITIATPRGKRGQ
jgi:hypothetical protein